MKLRSLSLLAFGPFTDHTLDFGGVTAPGLHVIHGPNEAGKSTALRAVLGLLFGIPRRTVDAHVHPMNELRVGARIESQDGRVIDVVRRKRDKDSLRDLDGNPLDEAVLARLLGGLDADAFQALFGFDHERLKRGGEALVEGRGAAGETLYEAALGGHGVMQVIEALRRQTDGLFSESSRAHKPEINRTLAEYRALAREQRDALISVQKWWQQSEQAGATHRELEQLEEQRRACRLEEQRLRGLNALMAPFARRRARREEQAALGALPRLPPRCRERRESAERALEQSSRELSRLEIDIPRRREELSRLSVPAALLGLSSTSAGWLSDAVGAHRKAARDLPALEVQVRALENDVKALLGRLGRAPDLSDVAALRLSDAQVAAIQAAVRQRYALDEKLAAAEQRHAELAGEQTDLRARLAAIPAAPDPAPLGARLRAVDRTLERRLAEAETERDRQRRELDVALRRAPGLAELGATLSEIELPSDEALDALEAAAREHAHQSQALAQERAARERALGETRRDRRRLELGGDVPTEAQLGQLRGQRDRAWQLIRRSWRSGADVDQEAAALTAGRPLGDAFEGWLSGADDLSDRLRREAERVAELSRLCADEEHLTAELARLSERVRVEAERGGEIESRALALWSRLGATPPPAHERRAWVRQAQAAQRLAGQLEAAERAVSRLRAEHTGALGLLQGALAAHGAAAERTASLAVLIELLEARVNDLERWRLERSKIEQQLAELEARAARGGEERDARRAELARWSERWAVLVQPLQLPGDASPEAAVAALDVWSELSQRLDNWLDKRRRVRAMEHDAERFQQRVEELVQAHLPELAGAPPDEAAEELVRRYREARLSDEQRARLSGELAQLEAAEATQRAAAELASGELRQLLEQAGLGTSGELEQAEQRAERAAQLVRDLAEVEDEIVQQLGGASLTDVERELASWDRARLQARLFELEAERERLENECAVTRDRWGGQQRALEEYGSAGADLAQDLESRAARLRDAVQQYAEARVGLRVLEREIERYREQNQGPILARANQIFPRLTLGRYRSISAGLEERTLRCVRDDATEVELAGLSEGTSYQLYFALRLASIERHLRRLEALPLVLDDVLIHFDDERTLAALALLGELAEHTQILLFTHHSRIVEAAREAVPARLLGVHALPGRSPQTWRGGSETLSSTSPASSASRVRVARSPSEITPTRRLP